MKAIIKEIIEIHERMKEIKKHINVLGYDDIIHIDSFDLAKIAPFPEWKRIDEPDNFGFLTYEYKIDGIKFITLLTSDKADELSNDEKDELLSNDEKDELFRINEEDELFHINDEGGFFDEVDALFNEKIK